MNIKKLLLITLAIFAVAIGSSMSASQVLCLNLSAAEECLEYKDLQQELKPYQDKCCEFAILLQSLKSTSGEYSQIKRLHDDCANHLAVIKKSVDERTEIFIKKRDAVIEEIRKQLNASIVLTYYLDRLYGKPYLIYFDPACDITQQVITQLNKEYPASKQQQIVN